MSNPTRTLQRLGEDLAYTFKGLHKQADWLDLQYRIYLVMPLIFSIVSLTFSESWTPWLLKLLAVFSLICSVLALINQQDYQKSLGYRELADEIKTVYDKAEKAFWEEDAQMIDDLYILKEKLSQKQKSYPIGLVARLWSKRKIRSEMNLTWLGGEYNLQISKQDMPL